MKIGKRRQQFDKIERYKASWQHLSLDELKEIQEWCYYGRRRKEAASAVRQLIAERQAETENSPPADAGVEEQALSAIVPREEGWYAQS